jgi:tRNA (adenine57-N1/adenine58-N1)-methyltransferase
MGVSRGSAEEPDWVALREDDGRAYLVNRKAGELKVKGLGRFNCKELLSGYSIGDRIKVGQKSLTIVDAALPEARRNMSRRAQTIGIKDSGFLISWMGLGIGSRVLEGGHGSAGLAMHLANVMGSKGCLISVENRPEHAEVGKHNMERMREFMPEFPEWHLLEMELVDAVSEIDVICKELDAAIIDIAEPWTVVANISEKIKTGGRIACYCPTTSQLEKSWEAVEKQNMIVEFAGEMVERRWSKAGRGGVRPGNQPMGHTAFLLIAAKIAPHSTEEE